MSLSKSKTYFVALPSVVLRSSPNDKIRSNANNHLILGDDLTYLDQEEDEWAKFYCRKSTGWLKKEWVSDKRMLEVNFVDIGQGDGCHLITPDNEIILIDAGEGIGFDSRGSDNMVRFMNWRHNLRNRKVIGVDGITENDPEAQAQLTVDHVIITHPDLDHYYGFLNIFKDPKIHTKFVGHNGIIERSLKNGSSSTWLYDFGRKLPPLPYKRTYHLWDTVLNHEETNAALDNQLNSAKYYIKTLLAARDNNAGLKFDCIRQSQNYFQHFTPKNALSLEILAPILEDISHEGVIRPCLKKLGNEATTKNGHSIVFQLKYGKLKMILGGDLNAASQDYLAQYYSEMPDKLSDLEKAIRKIKLTLATSTNLNFKQKEDLLGDLDEKVKTRDLIISKTKRKFGTDIAKACHHGSSDILDSFLKAINPLATIISSGDNESHSHPRPDALGAYGKSSRGDRPLLFSTELARSTHEFSYPIKFYGVLKKLEERMNEMTTAKDKAIYRLRMEKLRDSNVARYGMITVRTDGEQVIIAQKFEKSVSNASKWDIYKLKWNEHLQTYETDI